MSVPLDSTAGSSRVPSSSYSSNTRNDQFLLRNDHRSVSFGSAPTPSSSVQFGNRGGAGGYQHRRYVNPAAAVYGGGGDSWHINGVAAAAASPLQGFGHPHRFQHRQVVGTTVTVPNDRGLVDVVEPPRVPKAMAMAPMAPNAARPPLMPAPGFQRAPVPRSLSAKVAILFEEPLAPLVMEVSLAEEKFFDKYGENLPLDWVSMMDPDLITVSQAGNKFFVFKARPAAAATVSAPTSTPTPVSIGARLPPPDVVVVEKGGRPSPIDGVEKTVVVVAEEVPPTKPNKVVDFSFPKAPWLLQVMQLKGNSALIKVQSEDITRGLDDFFRAVWHDEDAKERLQKKFSTASPPAVGAEVVAMWNARDEFERAVVLQNERSPFLTVFLLDRGLEVDVHLSSVLDIPTDAPVVPPLSFWVKLSYFEDVPDNDFVTPVVLERGILRKLTPLYGFVLDKKGGGYKIRPSDQVDPTGTDLTVAIVQPVQLPDGSPGEQFVNQVAKEVVRLTYGLHDIVKLSPKAERKGTLMEVFASGRISVVLDNDVKHIQLVTEALRLLLVRGKGELARCCVRTVERGTIYLVVADVPEAESLFPEDKDKGFKVDVFRGCYMGKEPLTVGGKEKLRFCALDVGPIVMVETDKVYKLQELNPLLAGIPHKAQVCYLAGVSPDAETTGAVADVVRKQRWIGRRVTVSMPDDHEPVADDGSDDATFGPNGARLNSRLYPYIRLALEPGVVADDTDGTADDGRLSPMMTSAVGVMVGSADGDPLVNTTTKVDLNAVVGRYLESLSMTTSSSPPMLEIGSTGFDPHRHKRD